MPINLQPRGRRTEGYVLVSKVEKKKKEKTPPIHRPFCPLNYLSIRTHRYHRPQSPPPRLPPTPPSVFLHPKMVSPQTINNWRRVFSPPQTS